VNVAATKQRQTKALGREYSLQKMGNYYLKQLVENVGEWLSLNSGQ
jgi:hypothetical protein